jgi:hypothetical protein
VASVPANHVYVRHLAALDDDGVVRLDDVPPQDGQTVPGGWWPPVMLDPDWIRRNRDLFDVFHVHFGFDAKSPRELQQVVDALDAIERPLVLTIHDLENPHHRDVRLHDEQLRVLVSAAAEVVTLTPGAAAEIHARLGREATVIPHPHVLEPERIAAPRPVHDGFVVGLHAKSLRANMDVLGVAAILAGVIADLPGAELQINLHDEVSDPANHWYAPRTVARLHRLAARHRDVTLVEHAYFADEQLWDYLELLDVSVLPYRFGTHSGWLEACYDLGTTVVAPDCGYYAEQQPCLSYHHDVDTLDAASLADAIVAAYRQRPSWRADRAARLGERERIAAAHRAIYLQALGR